MIDPLIFGFFTIICIILSMYPIFDNIGDSQDLKIYNISEATILGNILVDIVLMMITISFNVE